jgi:regulation of enolase protein 1 (concanavalin A-like superfamily)/DNA-directed RNA polymerase subunit RPC12/RpoP
MSEFKYACPVCGQHMRCDSSQAGSVMECPTCFQKITVPQAPVKTQKFILAGIKLGGRRPVPTTPGESAAPVPVQKTPKWVIALVVTLVVVAAGAGAGIWGWKTFRPLRWQSSDVGNVTLPGAFGQTNGVMTISGDGPDIWNRADAFHFVYLAMKGDVTMTVRVTDIQNTDPWSKAGLMIRQSLDPDSAYALMAVTPGQGVSFQQRSTAGGRAVTVITLPNRGAPYWIRLTRAGNTFTAASSPDGDEWPLTNAITMTMTDPVYAGLAVTSHRSGVLCQATFAHLSVAGAVAKPPGRGDTTAPSATTKINANPTLNLAVSESHAQIVQPAPGQNN